MSDLTNPDAQQPDWYQQLGAMMQNPEPTWYDQLGEMMMKEGGEASLKNIQSDTGLAPYGVRHSGEGVKGTGYFGLLPASEGMSSEISSEDDTGEFPLLVPTLTREEIDYLLAGNPPTDEIYRKASDYAQKRRGQQKSPFADPTGLKYPLPERGMASGGQAFPLQDPEEEKRRLAVEGTDMRVPQKYPTLVKIGEGVKGVHEFLSKPFGYENPPVEFFSELLGIPAVGQTLEDIGYGMPLTKGAGMTTTVRPEVAEAALVGLPVAAKAAQVGSKGAAKVGKALAPTAADMLEMELKKSGMMMGVAPEGKVGKVKAPANEIGFYNPAEKAALNVQRKKGTGDAFLADLKKQPGVNDERLAELGLDQFKGRPNVTREEIIVAAEENRIPLQESVKRARNEAAIDDLERRHDELLDLHSEATVTGDARAREQYAREMADNIAEQKRLKNIDEAKFNPEDYPNYNTPGGTDYREIRVKLPIKRLTEDEARVVLGATPEAKLSEADINYASNFATDPFYHQNHHGDEPNVLFHLRVANHADAEGKKGLLIDELQSDWHQQGTKYGYKTKPDFSSKIKNLSDEDKKRLNINDGVLMENNGTWEWMPSRDEAENYLTEKYNIRSVPNAPFKNNWYQLGLKRAIKEAADTGMDRLYLTTGARQNERWSLKHQVDSLQYDPSNQILDGWKDGQLIISKEVPKDELGETIGKEAADKLLKTESTFGKRKNKHELSGVDLDVGGAGMEQWYDKNYKNYLEKYAKQHGSKLGVTHLKTKEEWPFPIQISSDGEKFWISGIDPRIDANNANLAGKKFDSWEEANKAREAFYSGHDEPVYYMDITPQMKESAKKGQSYRKGGTVKDFKLQQELKRYAVGGEIYNTSPDRSDGGLINLERNGYA